MPVILVPKGPPKIVRKSFWQIIRHQKNGKLLKISQTTAVSMFGGVGCLWDWRLKV